MTTKYDDWKKQYFWAIRSYPGIKNLYRDDRSDIVGTCTTTHYSKQGRRWVELRTETEPMPAYFYYNTVDAVPFFRHLGGTEHVELGHTCQGYIPVRISSTSPDKQSKTVRTFTFA